MQFGNELHLDNTIGCMIAKTYLIGKIVTAKTVKVQMKNTWSIKGGFKVIDKQDNLFLIRFEFENDYCKVLDSARWLVSN
ncbi:hypothetical protein Tsubulata_023256 [Turnera subulata]|uniref:DUF4283 domain-containing protein n=1 Tax=Turnera subulata TaxID=218843 RepID=A0A9Q0F058_9ROSI|nr:hypothetical protein Tsubulata_023256 [Turnera subulata]